MLGGLYDPDTGLVRFGARDYDPSIGRWTCKDPIGLESGPNVYAYCGGNPVNFVDPTGLDGVLTIQATSTHSWLEYTPYPNTNSPFPQGKTSYGTWQEGAGGAPYTGLHVNKERDMGLTGSATQSVRLSASQERDLWKFINDPKNNAWSNENNCSNFTTRAWEAAGQKRLEARSWSTANYPTPHTLKLNIGENSNVFGPNAHDVSSAAQSSGSGSNSSFGSLQSSVTSSWGSADASQQSSK